MTEREYMAILRAIIDKLFANWDGNLADFARDSGLHVSTIYRIFHFSGKRPQFRTILCMAHAAGIRLVFDYSQGKRKLKRVA